MKRIETPDEIIKSKKKTLIKNIIFVIIMGIAIYFILYMLFFDPMGNNYHRNNSLNVHYDLSKDLIPEPIQTKIDEEQFTEKVRNRTLTITKLAEYDITGRVEAIENYSTNAVSDALSFKGSNVYDYISPIDLTLSWGELALDRNAGHIKADQHYMNTERVVWLSYDNILGQKYDQNFIFSHVSNNHLISLNNGIRNELSKVKVSQVVRITGYLVGITCDDGSYWGPSSLKRTDTGNHACEIIYVTDFLIMK
jgi:hypothetical protein